MKKTFAIITAAVLSIALTGCGKKNVEETSQDKSNDKAVSASEIKNAESAEATTSAEPVVLDAFEKVAYYVSEDNAYYGSGTFKIELDLEDCPYSDYMHYNLEILSADFDTIKGRVTAQTEDITDYLASINGSFETDTMDFEFKVDELKCGLLKEEYYQNNKKKINDILQNGVIDAIQGYNDDADKSNALFNDLNSNTNNAENTIDTVSSLNDDIKLKSIYLCLPKNDKVDISQQEASSIISSVNIETSSYVSLPSFSPFNSCYGIFETKDGFYLSRLIPYFDNGKLMSEHNITAFGEQEPHKEPVTADLITNTFTSSFETVLNFSNEEECRSRIAELEEQNSQYINIAKVPVL